MNPTTIEIPTHLACMLGLCVTNLSELLADAASDAADAGDPIRAVETHVAAGEARQLARQLADEMQAQGFRAPMPEVL